MAKYLFVSWDGGGNMPPTIGIAQALRDRGHEVRFLGYETQRGVLAERSLELEVFAKSGQFSARGLGQEQRIAGQLKAVWACRDHLQELPAAVASYEADLVIIDVLMMGALVAAHSVKVPVVVLVHSAIAGIIPPPDSVPGVRLLAAVNALRAEAALGALQALRANWDHFHALVTTVSELDTAEKGPRVTHVGPVEERARPSGWASPWSKSDQRPLVLASFSTTGYWDPRGRMKNTLSALAEEPVRVLVCGREVAELGPLPPNAAAVPFVPHAEVLPFAAVTITHCGHGTIASSLRHGVPVVGLPNPAADQPYLGQRVQQLGAGVALEGEASPSEIRAAVRKVLETPSYRSAAQSLGASIAAAPGALGAAVALEQMVATLPPAGA